MALEIQQREREGITILELTGRITVGKEASTLRAKVGELSATGIKNLVLDLAHVDYITARVWGRW
jgi:anti-sigma B factor antagonist